MSKTKRQLRDAYRFAGFNPQSEVRGVFGDPMVRIMPLRRRRKKRRVAVVDGGSRATTIGDGGGCAICLAGPGASTWNWKYAASGAEAAQA
jgi:hypothetical protein